MGVQLNIKREETVELARTFAAELGKSVTDTIHEALDEKRQRREQDVAEKVRIGLEIAREASKHWHPKWEGKSSKEIMDSLYDERGLPM